MNQQSNNVILMTKRKMFLQTTKTPKPACCPMSKPTKTTRAEKRSQADNRKPNSRTNTIIMSDRPTGPLGVDPLHYVCVVFGLLICWVGYLLLPKGMRQQHFGAYPKRFRWSARPRSKRGGVDGSGSGGIAGRGQVSTMLHRVKGGGKASACLHLSANHRSERRSVCVIFIFSYSSSRIDVVQEAYLSYFNNPPPHQKHACMVIPHPVYQPTQIIIGT